MARSFPVLRVKEITRASLIAAELLAFAVLSAQALQAQDANSYILAARRSGAIEIIDPESLATIGRIHFDLPPKSVGLNGISASADGTMLYVEGPIPNDPNGCCVLYSIDLATLQTRQVADIPGTASRGAFVVSDGITYAAAALTSSGTLRGSNASALNLSPDGRWLFGVGNYGRGPFVNLYDLVQGKVLRTLVPTGLQGDWWPSGAWVDDRFYLYALNTSGSAARVWTVSPEATELGAGVAVEPLEEVPNCHAPIERQMTTAAGNLFLYEMFGWKLDRRTGCGGVPGGAWIIDPGSGRLLDHVAPDLYFSELVADREKGELYGISVGDPNWRGGVELVRIDAQYGTILQSRVLESDFWRIAFAPLRTVPEADVRALISSKK
jgi:hypothetical protein